MRAFRKCFCVSLVFVIVLISNVHAQQAETKEEAKEAAVKQRWVNQQPNPITNRSGRGIECALL